MVSWNAFVDTYHSLIFHSHLLILLRRGNSHVIISFLRPVHIFSFSCSLSLSLSSLILPLSLLLIYLKSVISCANNSRPNLLVYSRGLFPFKESCKPYKICVCFWHIIKFEMHSARICVKRNYMFIHNWAMLIFKP